MLRRRRVQICITYPIVTHMVTRIASVARCLSVNCITNIASNFWIQSIHTMAIYRASGLYHLLGKKNLFLPLTSDLCFYKLQWASTGLRWDTFYWSDQQQCPLRVVPGFPMASGLTFTVKDSSHSLVLTKHPKCFQEIPEVFVGWWWQLFEKTDSLSE